MLRPFLILLSLCAIASAGCGRGPAPATASAASAVSPAPDEDARTVYEADQALLGAFAHRDTAVVDQMLDEDFTWISADGVQRSRASVLAAIPDRVAAAIDAAFEARRLGSQIVVVQYHERNEHAMHVWVRRAERWRVLHVNEVIEGDRVVYGGTRIGDAPCINPCQEVPFAPADDAEKAVIKAWQAQQSGPEQWASHVPDDNIARTSNGTYTKADRLAVQQQQIKAGMKVAPSPLLWARIWAFGDSALMIALQPRAVGKPFWGSRVFELRNGTWVMVESYQTTVEDHPPF